VQFTPDLLPADLIGTLVFNPKSGDFQTTDHLPQLRAGRRNHLCPAEV
jgi:MoxR-like ATPase